MTDAAKIQQMPVATDASVDVLDSLRVVLQDKPGLFAQFEERVQLGVKKYGQRLQTFNGRDVLLDCKQEALDGVMYGQQAYLQGTDGGWIRDAFISIIQLIEDIEERNARK